MSDETTTLPKTLSEFFAFGTKLWTILDSTLLDVIDYHAGLSLYVFIYKIRLKAFFPNQQPYEVSLVFDIAHERHFWLCDNVQPFTDNHLEMQAAKLRSFMFHRDRFTAFRTNLIMDGSPDLAADFVRVVNEIQRIVELFNKPLVGKYDVLLNGSDK